MPEEVGRAYSDGYWQYRLMLPRLRAHGPVQELRG